MKYDRGWAVSEAVLTEAPEIISVVVVDLNLPVRVSSLIQLPLQLCNAGGQRTVRVCEAVDWQRVLLVSLEFLKEDPSCQSLRNLWSCFVTALILVWGPVYVSRK